MCNVVPSTDIPRFIPGTDIPRYGQVLEYFLTNSTNRDVRVLLQVLMIGSGVTITHKGQVELQAFARENKGLPPGLLFQHLDLRNKNQFPERMIYKPPTNKSYIYIKPTDMLLTKVGITPENNVRFRLKNAISDILPSVNLSSGNRRIPLMSLECIAYLRTRISKKWSEAPDIGQTNLIKLTLSLEWVIRLYQLIWMNHGKQIGNKCQAEILTRELLETPSHVSRPYPIPVTAHKEYFRRLYIFYETGVWPQYSDALTSMCWPGGMSIATSPPPKWIKTPAPAFDSSGKFVQRPLTKSLIDSFETPIDFEFYGNLLENLSKRKDRSHLLWEPKLKRLPLPPQERTPLAEYTQMISQGKLSRNEAIVLAYRRDHYKGDEIAECFGLLHRASVSRIVSDPRYANLEKKGVRSGFDAF
uniref:Uncharacterized protein n=1 Tax=Candidatus Kentrum sp. DK TaxID=2126562 RepID=A0A450T8A1_9GAMM|nr:MAG: hypothetical protein BECKDK2373B_GA0170837_105321 [Candidatus Kentron sp. DK]VFJ62781.1 MAG: hypothetical protein BECKDK2373C_GA0170839_110015 [Candidatus Kentron sp. DK]